MSTPLPPAPDTAWANAHASALTRRRERWRLVANVLATTGAVVLLLVALACRFVGLLSQALMVAIVVGAVWAVGERGTQAVRRRLVWMSGLGGDEARRRRLRASGTDAPRWHAVVRAAWWMVAAGTVCGFMPQIGVGSLLAIVGGCGAVLVVTQVARARLPSVGVSVVAALATVLLLSEAIRALLPTPAAEVILAPPVRGEWIVLQGGNVALINHHAVDPRQRWALDLVKLDDGEVMKGSGDGNADWNAWEQPLFAPASGTVVEAVDGIGDGEGLNMVADVTRAAGNHVVLDIGQGRYVLLAHIRQGTVAVKVGDAVEVGQPLGKVGNSGNTTAPHLHLQVQTRPALFDTDNLAVPFAFHEGGRALERNNHVGEPGTAR